MDITAPQLALACDCALPRAENWLATINAAMRLYLIDSPRRQAAFLAQVAHESGRLRYTREIWGPTEAQLRYEGRADLGNTQPGDGYRYLGRGLVQITGRANYTAARDGLRLVEPATPDFVSRPDLLEAPRWAALSAAWYWSSRGLNALADAGAFERITRRINGGTNGLAERETLWAGAKGALGLA